MPLRRGTPITHRPGSLTDSPDGTNAVPGSMRSLKNLIPSRTARNTYIARPAAEVLSGFPGGSVLNAGLVSAIRVIGDTAYGMIAANGGVDQPFAFDLATNTMLTVDGIATANEPTSPPATGDWTPPRIWQAGSRVVVAHPGFAGDGGSDDTAQNYVKVGWFDVSGFRQTIEVDLISGSPFLYGGFSTLGIQPGMAVTGSVLVPAGATVVRTFPLSQSANYFSGDSHSSDIIDNVPDTEMYIGKKVLGPGVIIGTTIIAHAASSGIIQLSQPTTSSVTGGTFLVYGNVSDLPEWQSKGDFTSGSNQILNAIVTDVHTGQLITATELPAQTYVTGVVGTTIFLNQAAVATQANAYFACVGSVIEMSVNATGSGQGPLLVTGGTRDQPLWGAGDTTPAGNILPSVPVGGWQMNGRSYYALGEDGIVWSDSLLAQIVSNSSAVQAYTVQEGLAVTAIAPLMLKSVITGGIVQSLIAFLSDRGLIQITGDQATSNLLFNSLPVQTGSGAPNSIVPATDGTYFVSPDGLRRIGFDGQVSEPIGQSGDGVVLPIMQAFAPSRISCCAVRDTIRVSVPGQSSGLPVLEYWHHLPTRTWSGPHTWAAGVMDAWGDTTIMAPQYVTAELWQSDLYPDLGSSYTENGQPMLWEYAPTALPDTGQLAENLLNQMALTIAFSDQTVTVRAQDMSGQVLSSAEVGTNDEGSAWGSAIWGTSHWGPASTAYQQRSVNFSNPLVFKQLLLSVEGSCDAVVQIGDLYMRYQILGYKLQAPA